MHQLGKGEKQRKFRYSELKYTWIDPYPKLAKYKEPNRN